MSQGDSERLGKEISQNAKNGDEKFNDLKDLLDKEIDERKDQANIF